MFQIGSTSSLSQAWVLFISHVKNHVMFLPPTPCFASVQKLQGVGHRHVGGYIFTTYIVLTLFFPHSPLQQIQTCVWDVSSPFKIVLVNASKVNAEETAKVNAQSKSMKRSFRSLLMFYCKHNRGSYVLGKDADPGSVLLFNLLHKASCIYLIACCPPDPLN